MKNAPRSRRPRRIPPHRARPSGFDQHHLAELLALGENLATQNKSLCLEVTANQVGPLRGDHVVKHKRTSLGGQFGQLGQGALDLGIVMGSVTENQAVLARDRAIDEIATNEIGHIGQQALG